MRVLALAVFMMVLGADQSASAASCGKGMLWPYVRNPGDCLTDAEVAAGARGVYNGPVNTNPDLGAMQQNPAVAAPAPAPQGPAPVQQPIAVNPNGVAVAPLPAQQPVTVDPNGVVASPAQVATYQPAPAANPAECTKSLLWPFVKKPGDCLMGTSAEEKRKRNGMPCYYRKPGDCQIAEPKPVGVVTTVGGVGPVAQANARAAAGLQAPAAIPAANPGSVPVTPVDAPAASTPVEPSCTKGAFWPFVKKAGDCATSAEQKRGR